MKYIVHTYFADFAFDNGNFALSFAEQLKTHATESLHVDIQIEVEPDPTAEESEVTE